MIVKKMHCSRSICAELCRYSIRGQAERDLAKCERHLFSWVPLLSFGSDEVLTQQDI
jgi:hypothetical protein